MGKVNSCLRKKTARYTESGCLLLTNSFGAMIDRARQKNLGILENVQGECSTVFEFLTVTYFDSPVCQKKFDRCIFSIILS